MTLKMFNNLSYELNGCTLTLYANALDCVVHSAIGGFTILVMLKL